MSLQPERMVVQQVLAAIEGVDSLKGVLVTIMNYTGCY